MSEFGDLIIAWNSEWKYDYWYRQKYKVSFGSAQHRELSQIDIKFMFLEQRMVEQERKRRAREEKEYKEFLKDGKYLKHRTSKKDEELFDDIDLSSL